MSRVSVVMISYNHEEYIEEAIKGVFNQKTDFDIEFILSNDSSTDKTDDIIKTLIPQAPEHITVKYTCHEKNLGMMQNFIWALQQVKTRYTAICDGDDYWTDPLKLSKQHQFLENNPDFKFCFHDASNFVESQNKFINIVDLDKHEHLSEANKNILFKRLGGSFPTSSAFFLNEILTPFPNFFSFFNVTDSPLILAALLKGKVGFLKEKMSVYRTTSDNWSAKNNLFENKWKNYNQKIITIDNFDRETNFIFTNELMLSKNNLNYQIIFAYFKLYKSKFQRVKFLAKNYKFLDFRNRIKVLFRLISI